MKLVFVLLISVLVIMSCQLNDVERQEIFTEERRDYYPDLDSINLDTIVNISMEQNNMSYWSYGYQMPEEESHIDLGDPINQYGQMYYHYFNGYGENAKKIVKSYLDKEPLSFDLIWNQRYSHKVNVEILQYRELENVDSIELNVHIKAISKNYEITDLQYPYPGMYGLEHYTLVDYSQVKPWSYDQAQFGFNIEFKNENLCDGLYFVSMGYQVLAKTKYESTVKEWQLKDVLWVVVENGKVCEEEPSENYNDSLTHYGDVELVSGTLESMVNVDQNIQGHSCAAEEQECFDEMDFMLTTISNTDGDELQLSHLNHAKKYIDTEMNNYDDVVKKFLSEHSLPKDIDSISMDSYGLFEMGVYGTKPDSIEICSDMSCYVPIEQISKRSLFLEYSSRHGKRYEERPAVPPMHKQQSIGDLFVGKRFFFVSDVLNMYVIEIIDMDTSVKGRERMTLRMYK